MTSPGSITMELGTTTPRARPHIRRNRPRWRAAMTQTPCALAPPAGQCPADGRPCDYQQCLGSSIRPALVWGLDEIFLAEIREPAVGRVGANHETVLHHSEAADSEN